MTPTGTGQVSPGHRILQSEGEPYITINPRRLQAKFKTMQTNQATEMVNNLLNYATEGDENRLKEFSDVCVPWDDLNIRR